MRTTGRTVGWWVAVLCVPLLFVVGCSADPTKGDSGGDPTSDSASPSESESPSDEPTEPKVPDAMANDDKAGAKAFVKYYWDVVGYAQLTGDLTTLKPLSFPTCQWCEGGTKGIRDLVPRTKKIRGGQLTISQMSVTPLMSGDVRPFQVDYKIDNAKQVVIYKDGSKKVYKASTSKYRTIVRRDGGGQWRVGLIEELE